MLNRLVSFFVERELLGNLITVFIFIVGTFSIFAIRKDLFPPVDFDTVLVSASMRGASSEQVEKLLVNPLEQAIRSVEGLEKVTSSAIQGLAGMVLTLDPDARDPTDTMADIRSAIDQIQNYPESANEPKIRKLNASDSTLIAIAITMEGATQYELREKVKFLANKLEDVNGVSGIGKTPWFDKEIVISVHERKLLRNKISLGQVIQAIRNQNKQLPAGDSMLVNKREEIFIKTDGELINLEDVRNTVIRANIEGYVVRVKDVADVSQRLEENKKIYRVDGTPSFLLNIRKKASADALTVVKRIKKKVEELKPALPANMRFKFINDFTKYLERRINVLSSNMIIGIGLVFFLLTLFLPFRIAIIVAIGIPFAMLADIALAYTLDLSINLLSLVGLIIVCGMVVDDVVVVVENIYRKIEDGIPSKEAIVNGTAEMITPVLSAVMTTIMAFLPLMFMTGIFGKFIFHIPLMVIGALLFSLWEGFFIAPCHMQSFGVPKSRNTKKTPEEPGLYKRCLVTYGNFIRILIRHRYLSMVGFLGIFILTGFVAKNMRFILFPPTGMNTFFVSLESNPGTELKEMERMTSQVEEFIKQNIPKSDLTNYISSVGIQQKRPNDQSKRGSNYAQIQVDLISSELREYETTELIKKIREKFKPPKKITHYSIDIAKRGPPQGAPISINIKGSDFAVLKQIANKLKKILTTIDGVHSIRDSELLGKRELRIIPDPVKINQAGLSVFDVAQTVQAAFGGVNASTIRSLDEEITIRVQMDKGQEDALEKIKKLKIGNKRFNLIPLTSVANIEINNTRQFIQHEGFARLTSVMAEVDLDKTTALAATKKFSEKSAQVLNAYPGYTMELGGESKDTNESVDGLKKSFLLAAFCIYIILILTFNNFWQPFLILCSIPMGIVGIIWALFLHGEVMSFMGMLAIVALSGIIVNNSIVFIDFFNKKCKDGLDNLENKLVETATIRLRPIILTSLTTVLGLMPTAYGIGGSDPFIVSLAIGIGWGLAVGSILATVAIPCEIAIAYDVGNFLKRIWRAFTGRSTYPTPSDR